MKRLFPTILFVLLVMAPVLAFAAPPPPGGSGGSGVTSSPEPLTGLLLALGAVPTYLIYRFRQRSNRPG